jgi:hypothetical protein
MNDKTDKNEYDEALPTQSVSTDPRLFDDSISAVTNELIIVSFYLPKRANPIIVNGAKHITIGRRDPKRRINPTIDLTEEEGAKLGVSRMHAELNFLNGQYYLKDTGSSNGTWINDTKLQPYQPHPVNSSDQIRIGQIRMGVHITLPQRNSSVISTLMEGAQHRKFYNYQLSDNIDRPLLETGSLTPSILQLTSTYLDHVIKVYNIVRQAQDYEAIGFQINAIHAEPDSNILSIEIGEGWDIMNFLAQKLPEFITILEGKTQSEQKLTDSLKRYPQPLEQIADYALQELVYRFLDDAQRDEYVRLLATYFEALLATHLKVQVSTNKQ